jgi:hypothetical protein
MATLRRYLAAGRDVTIDAATWRPGRLTSESTYLAARRLHRATRGASSRAALAAIRAVYEPRAARTAPDLPDEWTAALADVRRNGFGTLPPVLPEASLASIRDYSRAAPAMLRSITGDTSRGTFADRETTTALVSIVERFVLDQPDVQRIIASPQIAAFARAYFGATPIIHPPQLYWSCAGARLTDEARTESARQFHWDFDGLRGLRLHLYLTDVDEDAAPMSYLAGSHLPGALRSAALRSADLGVSDAAVWRHYPRSAQRTLTGPAGSTFVSDSQGLHRGSDALTTDRLFLVMPMQASGFAGYQLQPRTLTVRDPALREGIRQARPEFSLFHERRGADPARPGPDGTDIPGS